MSAIDDVLRRVGELEAELKAQHFDAPAAGLIRMDMAALLPQLAEMVRVAREGLEEIAHHVSYDGHLCLDPDDCSGCEGRRTLTAMEKAAENDAG